MPSNCHLTTLKHHSNILYRIHIYMQNSGNNNKRSRERHNINTAQLFVCKYTSLPGQKAATGAKASSLALTDLTAPIPATTARYARRLLHKETKTPFVVLRACARAGYDKHLRTRNFGSIMPRMHNHISLRMAVLGVMTHCAGRVSASMCQLQLAVEFFENGCYGRS